MARKRQIWCKHYRAMHGNATCEAGVAYDSLKPINHDLCPCFGPQSAEPPLCQLAVYPTAEEIEAEDKHFAELFQRTVTARCAIVEHLGGPWKKGMKSAGGAIECPVCKTGQLKFSRAGINGHIHAACTTNTCVMWME